MRQQARQSVGSRVLGEMVLAEMYLLEATLESAVALGNGLSAAGRRLRNRRQAGNEQNLLTLLRDTGEQFVEPYSVRYAHFRKVLRADWSGPLER